MSLFAPRTDLALSRDATGRFVPGVLAVMVFLAMLAWLGAIAAHRVVQGWQHGIEGRLTVQLPDLPDKPLAPRLTQVERELAATPGIRKVTVLDRRQVEALLLPWLGREGLATDLPLPGLIDVELDPGLDLQALGTKLASIAPGTTIDDPKQWLDRLIRLARLVEAVGLGILAAISTATVAMVIFATRAGLAAHRGAIEVLHLIGARDGYIANQFQWQTLSLALFGALAGTVLAGAVVGLLAWLAAGLDSALLPSIAMGVTGWGGFAAIPILAVLLATLTARLTVMDHLRSVL